MEIIPWWHLYPWWPFVAFCDLSVFLHDGLWCKVPLLWTLPYFVLFVTIMAFMVVQFRICFWWVLSNTVDLACSLGISSPRCFTKIGTGCSFGMAPSQLKMFHLSTSLPMMCTWSMSVLNAAGNAFSEKQLQVVHLVHQRNC